MARKIENKFGSLQKCASKKVLLPAGQYNLTVTFEIGTDLNMAQVLVENRVTQALPLLPSQVQLQGVTTKKRSPSILLAISLISPDGRCGAPGLCKAGPCDLNRAQTQGRRLSDRAAALSRRRPRSRRAP